MLICRTPYTIVGCEHPHTADALFIYHQSNLRITFGLYSMLAHFSQFNIAIFPLPILDTWQK